MQIRARDGKLRFRQALEVLPETDDHQVRLVSEHLRERGGAGVRNGQCRRGLGRQAYAVLR